MSKEETWYRDVFDLSVDVVPKLGKNDKMIIQLLTAYAKHLSTPRSSKPKVDRSKCGHTFVEINNIFKCSKCGEWLGKWLHDEMKTKAQ